MRNLDILAAENGEHVRVLLCGEEQSYVVSCQHFRISNIYKSKQIPVVRRNLLVYFYLSVYSMPLLSLFP